MSDFRELLKRFRQFQECVLLEVRWLHEGVHLEFIFDYIWTPEGKIRSNLTQVLAIRLRLELVQEFHVRNALNDVMCAEPEQINWGLSEVDVVRLEDHADLLQLYAELPRKFHHLAMIFGGGRRFDVVFSNLTIDFLEDYQARPQAGSS